MNPTRLHLAADFAYAVVCLFALTGLGCGEDECELNAVTRELGGAGLVDCGLATGDSSDVDRCAITAHRNGSTFRALYEREDGGVDVIMRIAGGDYVALRLVPEERRIEQATCDGGRVTVSGGRSYVECEGRGEFGLVCR
jgi:hypothetical protein